MKKILLISVLFFPLFALDIEKLILVNKYAEELDLTENTLWFEFTKNGNRCVMYNSQQDLAGFQFNFKDMKVIPYFKISNVKGNNVNLLRHFLLYRIS